MILWILAVVVVIAAVTFIAVKRLKPPFDNSIHPECMTCDEESCIGCPIIETKRRNLK